MKIFLLPLVFILGSSVGDLQAQTFVQVGTGTDTSSTAASAHAPVYRPSATSNTRNNRSNTIYVTTELASMPIGSVITALAWEKANAGGTIPGNPLRLEIWMRNSPLVAPLDINRTWTSIVDSFSQVYNNLNTVIPTVPGWVTFNLDQPFTYLGGAIEVATENELGGTSPFATALFNWYFTLGSGDFALGGTGSPTFGFPAILNNTNVTAKNRSNIRFFYTPPPALDMRTDAITSPQLPVPANSVQAVSFDAFNGGTATISSANIHYRMNGGTVVTESWTGTLAPFSGTNIVFQTLLTLPSSGQINLEVWLSNVNGLGLDNNPLNDSLNFSFCLALPAGNYTVGTPTSDFSSLQDAIDFLNCGGVSGQVVFLIQSGSYTGSYNIGNIFGAVAPGSITFTSASGVASDVVLTGLETVTSPDVFNLNGTSGITFSNLRFVKSAVPADFSYLLHLRAGSNNILINNCEFVDQSGNATDQNRGVGMFNTTNVTLSANSFTGFARSVIAQADGFVLNNQWLDNSFSNYLADAFFILNQQHAVVRGNTFTNFIGTGTSAAACSLRAQRNITVEGNRVYGAIPRYAFIFFDFDNDPLAGPNRIFNNEVAGFTSSSITSATAIRQCYVITGFQNQNVSPANIRDQYEFVNNTAYLGVNSGSVNALQAVLSISGGSDNLPSIDTIVLLNNNLVAYALQGGSMPPQFRIMNFNVQAPINTSWSNHNNFYFEGNLLNPLIRLNSPATDYATIAAWSAAQAGRDSNSVSINPVFLGTASAQPTSGALNNLGTSVSYVQSDILGVTRSATTPDIGAYEFDAANVELSLTALLHPSSACGLPDTAAVRFVAANLGIDTLIGFELLLQLNGVTVQNKLFNDTLLPGASRVLVFDSLLNLSVGGAYGITIFPPFQLDPNTANDTLRVTVVNQLINQFPYLENFDALPSGIPAFTNGWSSSSASYRWFVNSGGTSTGATGPSADATTGSSNGRYLYTEASNGSMGNEAMVTSTCLDLSGLNNPMLEFFYHGHGIDCDQLIIEHEVNNSWIPLDTLFGPTHTHSTQAWFRHRLPLDLQSSRFRFRAIRGASFEGDWAIDDVRIANWPQPDVRVTAISIQTDGCDSLPTPIIISIKNEGSGAVSNVPGQLVRNGGIPSTFGLNRTLAPGATDTIQLSLPFVQAGNQQLLAYTSLAADTDFRLDTARASYFIGLKVNSFPYVENFDAPGLWHAGGINSSWQRATPAANVITNAFNGSASWVTNPTGLVNSEERSWLESPCFNFSQLAAPELSFAIWYNTLNTAGGNLQYSTNGGNSWQVLGSLVSGQQWYTVDSLPVSRGQALWSGIISPSGWRLAQHSLHFLAGEPSVKFRFQFFSPATNLLSEGLAIDSFRIGDPAGSLPLQTNITPANCTPVPHVVTTNFSNATAVTQAELLYRVNGGAQQVLPMTAVAGQYSATIPAQAAGAQVSWNIRSSGSAVYTTPAKLYTDGFVQPDIDAQTGPLGSTLVVDSRVAVTDTLRTLIAPGQLGSGIFVPITASRHLELRQLGVELDKRTSLQLYFASGTSTSPPAATDFALLANILDVRPDSSVYSRIQLSSPLKLQANQSGWLYLLAGVDNALRLSNNSVATQVSDSNLVVSSGLLSTQPFVAGTQLAMPSLELVGQNPVDSISWFVQSAPAVSIGSARMQSFTIGAAPVIYGLSLVRAGCVRTDTFELRAAGTSDLSVEAILEPTVWNQLQQPVAVKAVIRNMGTLPALPNQLRLFVNNIVVSTLNINPVLAPGDSVHLSFAPIQLNAQAPGINICVALVGGDGNPANDTACLYIGSPESVRHHALGVVRVYPNPANDFAKVQWETPLQQDGWLLLRDARGRVIQRQPLEAGSTEYELRLPGLATGMYQLELNTAGSSLHRKLLIQR